MKLADKVQEWINANEWDDKIDRNEESCTSSLCYRTDINGQPFTVFVDTDENKDYLKIFVYAPFNCIANKRIDCVTLFNRINMSITTGKILLLNDNRIVIRIASDFENAEPSLEVIQNMVNAGLSAFQNWFDEISSVALTKTTAQEIFDELDSSEEQSEQENNVPDEV